MRIYIFKSETRKDLRAFAGDLAGSRLPQTLLDVFGYAGD
jgi:hypothetical protein